MKIDSFIKRLNATEIGAGVTNDTYIAIPKEVDLSGVLHNKKAMTLYDCKFGKLYTPENSNIQYVQTGQNGQERISGLGQYFRKCNASVGDEVLIEKITEGDKEKLFLDFNKRDVIVFQKNSNWVELLTKNSLDEFENDYDYVLKVVYKGSVKELVIKKTGLKKKKVTSPVFTTAYDLLISDKSILSEFGYLEYIEIAKKDDVLMMNKMKTYILSKIESFD